MRTLLWAELGRLTHAAAVDLFEPARQAVRRGEADLLLFVEHDPIWTIGRNAARPVDDPGSVRTGRGGNITWHGPGQLVAYPIVALGAGATGRVRDFVAAVETSLVEIARTCRVEARLRQGEPGAWVQDEAGWRKLGSVGISVRRGVTAHGFALNLDARATRGFAGRAPCAIESAVATSLEDESGQSPPAFDLIAERLARTLAGRLKREPRQMERDAILAQIAQG